MSVMKMVTTIQPTVRQRNRSRTSGCWTCSCSESAATSVREAGTDGLLTARLLGGHTDRDGEQSADCDPRRRATGDPADSNRYVTHALIAVGRPAAR